MTGLPEIPDEGVIEAMGRGICAETCAFMGEPPCYQIGGAWPPKACDDPGCIAQARAAYTALRNTLEDDDG